ncbi:MAG: nitroreductase family protein, partial [Oscillospiraceae bacterium]|nr:nitroreductase family protein [Oscillospiraceae bacterium]
ARYIFLDTGHVCQNLYLAGYTNQIGVCAIGAFKDDVLNVALGVDGEEDFVVYGATVGKMI